MSLLGRPLLLPPLPDDVRARREHDLEQAQQNYDRDPHDERAIIWLGRRLAYLGQFKQAIATFSNGLAIHPESVRLLRHRGHRLITIRDFDGAIADLSRAAHLARDLPDELEPDGQPNRLNQPRSTTKTNIFYHLGVAHYLKGNWQPAQAAFRECLDRATNDDTQVAATYWLVLSLRRLNDREGSRGVQEALDDITPAMDVIENQGYYDLLRMFKGELAPDEMNKAGEDDPSIDAATLGYGIGAWRLMRGERDRALQQFEQVIKQTNWAAFGHIAAEAELAQRSGAPIKPGV